MNIPLNVYTGDFENLKYGRVLALEDLEIRKEGYYWLDNGDNISIINIIENEIKYELGRIYTC